MTPSLEPLVETLESAGYRCAGHPLHVAELSFEFDAVLTGPGEQRALVVVAAAEPAELDTLRRHLRALALSLERTGSTRPMTLVLVTPDLTADRRAELAAIGRLVVVPPETPVHALRGRLLELMPLELPDRVVPGGSGEKALREHLGELGDEPLARALRAAAAKGADEVERTVLDHLERVIGEEGAP